MEITSMSTRIKEVVNPNFEACQLMGFEHSKDLWDVIQKLFDIQSRVEEDYLRQTFQQTRKGQDSSPAPTRAFISQVLLGLDEEYNAIVATLQEKPELSCLQMQLKLHSYEKRLQAQNAQKTVSMHNTPIVNMVTTVDNQENKAKVEEDIVQLAKFVKK
ncbi:Retrovirus-related Pol polyprotein from transposon TNT 1-94 [Cucumis melo var. makuwa]|uniref:Retrovirus-related Pol polyprotein from transposon TNT 1-94 n=1 Tax=Cucumis melo var. makuwa TaxID=1194695 RepID=A0A5D3DNN4_CUCMM|nr:Retrovirus-related Pol polyprotein from transposon TNT 1-94 [Cucumis melo var. makuwa]